MNRIYKIFTSSFPLRLSLVVLGLVSVLFSLSFLANSTSARRHVRNESIERAQSSLDNTILRINHVLRSVEITVHNMAWLVNENLDNPERLYDLTRHIVESNDFISGSAIAFEPYYYDEFGCFYSPYSYRDGDSIRSIQLGTSEYDYHFMDWYQIPKLLNSPYWSEPYYDEDGGNIVMTTYAYPIYDQNGILTAMFTADLSLEWFAEQVNSIKPYPNAYNIMIGRGGTFLVHNQKDNILNETIFTAARMNNDEKMVETAHQMIRGGQGIVEFEEKDTRFTLFYAPVEATGWSVGVACLHSDIFASVESVRKYSYLMGIIGLLLMTLICFLVVRRMSRPLVEIADAAIDIAQGNLMTELPKIGTNDEMHTLCDSFLTMQQSLVSYIDELQSTTAKKERIESELHIARSLQLGMVPKIFPPFPEREDVDMFARMTPAREVGGDLYDFFIEDEKLYFIIGDVSGKGVPASLVMAVTCRLFRTIASYVKTPEGIVSTLNNALSESNESNMFCTAFVGILDLKNGCLQYCNAGHNPPIMIRPEGGAEVLTVIQNLAMGVWYDFEYKGQTCSMAPDSAIFMYTDGVTEAEDVHKSLYGDDRLLQLLQKAGQQSPRTIVENVLEDLERYASGAEQSDDITILCCRLNEKPDDSDCREIVLKNRIEEITRMSAFLEEMSEELNLSMEDTFNINLAIEEAVTNVIMYAYPRGEEHEFKLSVRHVENRLIFKLTDTGKEFDPTAQPDADVTLPLEERPIGGLGIYLIRKIMETVKYRRADGRNVLTMVKIID
jgi:sigma-B regulation protein RsbU (phosphoserine phosphatase)